MKINEMERLTGVAKKNIRYYEQEGLLAPGRNSENGYREYGQEDVSTLRRIQLLRKLSVPIAEIRTMQQGTFSVSDGARRHIVVLERAKENIDAAKTICERLAGENVTFASLDAETYLTQMEQMEKAGTSFMDVERLDRRMKRKRGALIAGITMIAIMLVWIVFFICLCMLDCPPWPVVVLLLAIPIAVCVGIVIALKQRMKEIQGGEEDAAGQY